MINKIVNPLNVQNKQLICKPPIGLKPPSAPLSCVLRLCGVTVDNGCVLMKKDGGRWRWAKAKAKAGNAHPKECIRDAPRANVSSTLALAHARP